LAGETVVLVTFGIAMTAGFYNFNKLYLQDFKKLLTYKKVLEHISHLIFFSLTIGGTVRNGPSTLLTNGLDEQHQRRWYNLNQL
jgi:hypothetical protein